MVDARARALALNGLDGYECDVGVVEPNSTSLNYSRLKNWFWPCAPALVLHMHAVRREVLWERSIEKCVLSGGKNGHLVH
jgi:hypothetical protein